METLEVVSETSYQFYARYPKKHSNQGPIGQVVSEEKSFEKLLMATTDDDDGPFEDFCKPSYKYKDHSNNWKFLYIYYKY